ncbi:MAG: hypothetical protein RIA65_17555 [Woeseia sp.]
MDSAITSDAADAAEPSDPVADSESVATHVAGWFAAHRARIRIISELALAEAKLAATSVALMAFLGTIAAILVLTAWGLIVAGGIFALLAAGAPLWAMLVVLAVGHLLVAGLLARKVLTLSKHMGFVATREQLQATGGSS